MPSTKIGKNITAKNEDQVPYYTLGIAKTEDGFEVRELKVFGMEVQVRKVVLRTKDRAEAMHSMRLELANYIINFNVVETKEKKK